ncbi:MAG: hypothetical protein NVS9B15_06550 [Acidobacteriaceae bacterium]
MLSACAFPQNNAGTRVEVTPFGGFETGASAPLTVKSDANGNPTSAINSVSIHKGGSYGAFFDYSKSENFQYEFMWVRNSTSLSQHDFIVGNSFDTYSARADQYQFGVLFHLLDSTRKLRPYIAGGVGFTHTVRADTPFTSASNNPDFIPASGGGTDTAFAFNLGAGAKFYATRHIGLRLDGRFLPSYATSTQGVICDELGFCSNGTKRNFYQRLNLGAGVILRF